MTTHAKVLPAARDAPAWAAARWAAFLVTLGCVVAHATLLMLGPSVLSVAMAALALLCLICLRPGPRSLSPGAWGAAMAMSAAMMLVHIRSSGGMAPHSHGVVTALTPVDDLHGMALLLNGIELLLLMSIVTAIGVVGRRRMSAAGGTRSVNVD
jgi:hypothetical protein